MGSQKQATPQHLAWLAFWKVEGGKGKLKAAKMKPKGNLPEPKGNQKRTKGT